MTTIELIVGATITAITASLLAFAATSKNDHGKLNPLIFPQEARAQAQQDLVKEMAEQNRLMRELLQQQKFK